MNEVLRSTSVAKTIPKITPSSGIAEIDLRKYVTDPRVSSIFSALHTSANQTRKGFQAEIKRLENFYLIDTIIGSVIDDALSPELSTGEILELYSENQKLNDILKEFQKDFDLDNIVQEFLSEMLLETGEYYLRPKVEKGKGIVSIFDDVDSNEILSFYQNGFPIKFMKTIDGKATLVDPSTYAHFILNSRKIKVQVSKEVRLSDKIPDEVKSMYSHCRIGRPLLYGVLSKIKELEILEKLVPGIKLANLTAGSIVGVEVPPATAPKDAFDIARKYEELFNMKTSVNQATGEMTAADILAVAGRIKAIPTFGGKGNVTSIDAKSDSNTSDIQSSISDTREVICSSIAFPAGLIYGGMSKGDILKQNSRYLRKIKSVRSTIANGLIQLALIHVSNLDIQFDVTFQDITVRFKNESVNIDELEKLEYMDASVGFMKGTIDLVAQLSEAGLGDCIDKDKLKDWISDKLIFISTDRKADPDSRLPKTGKELEKTANKEKADAEAKKLADQQAGQDNQDNQDQQA